MTSVKLNAEGREIKRSEYYRAIHAMVKKHGKEQTGHVDTGVVDMLSNLLHICDEHELDFADLERQARNHYRCEISPLVTAEIKPTKTGFTITRRACVVCGEPPFGDEYCCGHNQSEAR